MNNATKPAAYYLLTESVETDFKAFLASCYGLYIHTHQVDKFKQAIYKICQKFGWHNPNQLLSKLKSDSLCPERLLLIQEITVDESYFFRDENQQHFLKNNFLPNLIAQKRSQQDKHIRIWSAGCSNGQEIYSIVILLHQLLTDFSDWKLQLIASDINHESLKQAIKAEYSNWEIRSNEDFISQSDYFTKLENDKYQLNDIIKKQVKFFFLNLAEDCFPSLMNQTCNIDLILCRNVFIYFQPQIIEETCARFSQALKPDGVLLLSATDPMNFSIPQLIRQQAGDVFYFKRVDDYADFSLPQPTFYSESKVNVNLSYQQNNQAEDFSRIIAKILSLLGSNQWHEVLAITHKAFETHPDKPELAQFKAKALVNLGLLDEAKIASEESIRLSDLDPHTYLLYGSILLQLNLYDEAEKAFRQTLFLNYDFMEAHYQLGQVLLYKGQQKQAIKAIRNALRLAEQGDEYRAVHNVMALTYGSFAETMKNELSVLNKHYDE